MQVKSNVQPAAPGYWVRSLAEVKRVKAIVGGGMLAALGTVLRGLAIPLSATHRISFTLYPIAVAGYMYGPFMAGLAAVVMDIMGYLLNPMGAYFPGFAVVGFINGFIFGCWLYKKEVRLWRIICAVCTSTLIASFILNPLLLQFLYGMPFWVTVAERVITNAVQVPIYIFLIYCTLRTLSKQAWLISKI